MDATATYHYDAVRFLPSHSVVRPFQVLASSISLEETPFVQQAVVGLTLEDAVDLHESLGRMILGMKNDG